MSITQLIKRRSVLVQQREKAFEDGRMAQAKAETLTQQMKSLDKAIKEALDKSTATGAASPAPPSPAQRSVGKRGSKKKVARRTSKKKAVRKKAPARKASSSAKRPKKKQPIADIILKTLSKDTDTSASAIKNAVAKAGHSRMSVSVKLADMKKAKRIANPRRGMYRLPA